MLVQAGLRRTCSETTLLVFPQGGSNVSGREDNNNVYLLWKDFERTCTSINLCTPDPSSLALSARILVHEIQDLEDNLFSLQAYSHCKKSISSFHLYIFLVKVHKMNIIY